MAVDVVNNDLQVNGTLSPQKFNPPAGSITNAAIQAAAALDPTKMNHRNTIPTQLFGPTTTVTALTQWLYTVHGATATLQYVLGMIAVQATGGDRTVTVDIQKSTGGGAFATIMSVTVNITNATVIRTAVNGTISNQSLVAGDILEAVVTVAGVAGAQAQGLIVTLVLDETPN
jgi:hypothetical protein